MYTYVPTHLPHPPTHARAHTNKQRLLPRACLICKYMYSQTSVIRILGKRRNLIPITGYIIITVVARAYAKALG
ncbi:hypothetical protein K504DRAFT_93415 [Pleomassaria siparia CBS 279.74]|uniref:Uncharacterized protein n=1 Tax=Pleomassaria siparia CBS 279.74 TaxID=1314801 RepID=A0A6G1JZH3_9PLEO|nr:hypothetical protein K504DRAFT_93415 [Pleomassaria siparia CBS 279.74]